MSLPQTGATQYHEELGLSDKGRAFNGWLSTMIGIFSLDLLNGLALGCYQPSFRYESCVRTLRQSKSRMFDKKKSYKRQDCI